MKTKEFILNDGMKLLPIGLGTYRLNGREGMKVIQCAMEIGYRLLDSIFSYKNKDAVSEATRTSCMPRSELIVTPKLPGRHQKYREVLLTTEESLYHGGLDYYSTYLTHQPSPEIGLYVEVRQTMVKMKKRGMTCSVGMCNFLPEHLERLTKETGVTPSINQIELHSYLNQEEQRGWGATYGIVDESWGPFRRANSALQDPVIGEVAKARDKSILQTILHWHVQLGVLPIPELSDPARRKENLEVFDFVLSEEEVQKICALGHPDGRTANQNLSVYEEFRFYWEIQRMPHGGMFLSTAFPLSFSPERITLYRERGGVKN